MKASYLKPLLPLRDIVIFPSMVVPLFVGREKSIKAIQEVFNNKINNVSVSSTKSQTGHLLGAAGAIEAIFSILTIKNQIIPATMNLVNPLEHNKIDIIKEKPKRASVKNVLSNSFGFGGTNVSLIFKNLI